MKIFVTGGTGFIGSHFIEHATMAGHEIVSQRRPGSQTRVQLSRQPIWIDRALDQDFTNELSGCDALVHFAAHTPNPPYAELDECLYWNVFSAVKLMQQAATQGVKDMLVAGTCFEYGAIAGDMEAVPPHTSMQPSLTYPISKAAATTACLGLARSLGLRMQVLRIFQVYGEGEAPTRFWPSLRKAALNGFDFEMSSGQQIRDFIPVSSVAKSFVNALQFQNVRHGFPHVRNIGSGQGQSLLEFAQHWWKEWGATGQLKVGRIGMRQGELKRLVANIEDVAIG